MISKLLITTDQFPFCLFLGEILEKLLFNSIMDFLEENNLLNSNQSGFRSNDSCESQLLSIVHDIYSSFDCYPSLEVRGIFLDISKAFDRVWHEGLIYKIQSTGISGTPLKLIKSFLSGRFQCSFEWSIIFMVTNTSRCTLGLYFRTTILSNTHKWSR